LVTRSQRSQARFDVLALRLASMDAGIADVLPASLQQSRLAGAGNEWRPSKKSLRPT
jgi:hypothetical protein